MTEKILRIAGAIIVGAIVGFFLLMMGALVVLLITKVGVMLLWAPIILYVCWAIGNWFLGIDE